MKKPKLDKPAKPTKEPTAGDNAMDPKKRELFLSDLEKWKKLDKACKDANKKFGEHKKVIAEDGFTLLQIKVAALVGTPEGEAEYRDELAAALQAAQWVGAAIGSQLQLFLDDKDRTPLVDRAFDEGVQAAMSNQQAKPPYDPGSEGHQRFLDGFHSVTANMLKAGIKPLGSDMH